MKDKIEVIDDKLVFTYVHDFYIKDVMLKDIEENETIVLKGFIFSHENILQSELDNVSYEEITNFCLGYVEGDFIRLNKNVFGINHEFYFKKNILIDKKIENKWFVIGSTSYYRRNTNVINIISAYAKCDCFVVNDNEVEEEGYIYFSAFKKLISNFPTSTELAKYKFSRIESIIGDNFSKSNAIEEYENYMRKKSIGKSSPANIIGAELDIQKYELIIKNVEETLKQDNLTEKEWQERLVPFIRLLYPRFIKCLQNVPVIRTNNHKDDKEIDYLLVDVDGNAMILELKKPFKNKSILTKSYRKNFYKPSFELGGGIQQIEGYIYDLNLYKKENIDEINEKYKDDLAGIKIKLIDVQGALICGRSNEFDDNQKRDFEIIRNQYKNIVDIITYDDLIFRLKRTIEVLSDEKE